MSVDPRGYSRGKRGIAGSLIFNIFDRAALARVINREDASQGAKYFARPTDVANPGEFSAVTGLGIPREDTGALLTRGGGAVSPAGQVFINDLRPVNYVDQMPPFDIVLSAQNEMGIRMFMQVFGVELLNQGSGVSVDDIVVEAQMTFVARSVIDWTPLPSARTAPGGNSP